MTRGSIKYSAGYKYQLREDCEVQTSIRVSEAIVTPFITLRPNGILIIKAGYCWDGPSGPTIDTHNFMRGSLIHDALYQLIREGRLDREWRNAADRELQRICIEDGMSRIRAWWVYVGVRWFADYASRPHSSKPILQAP